MKNSKKIFILTEGILAILAAATALGMLGESNGSRQKRVSVIIQASDDSQWSAFKYGLRLAAEDLGIEMFVVSTSGQMSVQEEEELIQWEMDSGVDAMIVQPIPGEAGEQLMRNTADSVPLMLVGWADEGEAEFPVTGPDHYAMGKTLAQELLEDYGGDIGGKTLGIVSENEDAPSLARRKQGFLDGIAGQDASVLWTVSEYGERAEYTLELQPEADFVIALDNGSLVSAGKASAEKNLHGALVYGIGNSAEAIYYVDFGSAECMVVPDEFNMGYQSLSEVAGSLAMFSGGMESRTVSHTVIRRENLFTEENQEILFTMSQ